MLLQDKISEGLTFDDVLLPAASEVQPTDVDTSTQLTKTISLKVLCSLRRWIPSPEAPMAIAMAQQGALGIIHRNMTIEEQAEEVRRVKRYESGMVVNPITILPTSTLAQALETMRHYNISGVPVTEENGKLVGILTNRDVRFAENPNQPVQELMTSENLVTVVGSVDKDEARRLLHKHRIEKLLVVDKAGKCIGLITVKDIEKSPKLSAGQQR